MGFTRRDLLKFTGGATVGLVLTPVPWGLLRDTALLSETWPGVPQPARGEVRTRYTTCTLCPAACGVRARCVGEQPVSLAGVPEHPASRGALCANGLVAHHLPFCSDRATRPLANGRASTMEQAVARIRTAVDACGPDESVAILDPRPGRAASLVYRRYLAGLARGVYCAASNPFGVDLENTRAIVSFGVPVLDGWLSPGRVFAVRSHFALIQVEPEYSRTASLADLWVPIVPGGEAAFAGAVESGLRGEPTDPAAERVARMLLDHKPAIAIGPGAEKLNISLGSVGKPGGFLRRRDVAPATDFADLPDRSVRVLFTEEASLPWSVIERKLVARGAVVVALTAWHDAYASHADYVIPAPLFLESLDEAATPAGSTVAGFSLSPALVAAPQSVIAPPEFILRLAGDSTTYPDILKQRVAGLKKDGQGSVFTYADAKSTRVRDIGSADDLWKLLLAGALWLDDPLPQSGSAPLRADASYAPAPHRSPLMSKLDQESGLRRV
ncbi:MAG TPA: hypothetical protein VMT86_12135 [Bryobacteraceae bacterium]|nr:hypothetical protein [Bryobacteraceae bacterium]